MDEEDEDEEEEEEACDEELARLAQVNWQIKSFTEMNGDSLIEGHTKNWLGKAYPVQWINPKN